MKTVDLSIVIPAYNEQESIELLLEELGPVLSSMQCTWEILLVDDASTDATPQIIQRATESHPQIFGFRLLRNTGKGGALEVGFAQACGQIIITMDADLQDNPAELPRIRQEILDGADMVIGWKKNRKDGFGKRIPSKCMNFVTSLVLGSSFKDMNSGLKGFSASVLPYIPLSGSLYRFMPHVLVHRGFTVHEIPVHHRARKHGVSKFGIRHRLLGLFDLCTVMFLIRFRDRPLHLFGRIGAVMFGVGAAISCYLGVVWLQGEGIGQRPLLTMAVLCMILGFQVASTGLIGELVVFALRDERRRASSQASQLVFKSLGAGQQPAPMVASSPVAPSADLQHLTAIRGTTKSAAKDRVHPVSAA